MADSRSVASGPSSCSPSPDSRQVGKPVSIARHPLSELVGGILPGVEKDTLTPRLRTSRERPIQGEEVETRAMAALMPPLDANHNAFWRVQLRAILVQDDDVSPAWNRTEALVGAVIGSPPVRWRCGRGIWGRWSRSGFLQGERVWRGWSVHTRVSVSKSTQVQRDMRLD